MKKTIAAFCLSILPLTAFALDASSISGTWRTIAETCENSGTYINGYQEQTKLKKTTIINANGTMVGDFRSVDGSYQLTFKSTFTVVGNKLTSTTSEYTESGKTYASVATEQRDARLSGNLLILSHQITGQNQACPVGDTATTILSRIKN